MSEKHPDILTKSRRQFFEELSFTLARGLYLAGGTALALQIGHRASVDFDFYTGRHFKKGTLVELFDLHLKEWKFKVARDEDNTLELNVEPDIHLSCFYYRYPLLEQPRTIARVWVAGLKDIAAMKLVAISQRGTRRDFVDMYYLLQRFTLKEILRFTQEKYPEFDIYNGLRGLLYFKDADEDSALERAMVFDRTLTWAKAKRFITDAVNEFQKSGALE